MINRDLINNKKRYASVVLNLISAIIGIGMIYYSILLIIQKSGFTLYHITMVFSGVYLILSFVKTLVRDNDAYIYHLVSYIIFAISNIFLGVTKIINGDNIATIILVFVFAICCLLIAFYKRDFAQKKYLYLYTIIIGTIVKIISIITSKFSFMGAITLSGIIITDNSRSFSIFAIIIAIFICVSQVIYILSFEKNDMT